MSMQPFVASPRLDARAGAFATDVAYYLALDPRQLPSRYLYDALGSALFDAICELPWYGVTRAELGLLDAHGQEIVAQAAPLSRIVELGPGNGAKLLTLLLAARGGRRTVPPHLQVDLIDVSPKALAEARHALATVDAVTVVAHEATYEAGLVEVGRERRSGDRTLVLFLGSNIGNFDRPGAEAFLRNIRTALVPGDDLLVGADLVKPEADLVLAYDDPLGVTAAFNRNLLIRINRELDGDFDLGSFGHRAVWNREESRIEMHLVSLREQRVQIAAAHVDIEMREGETIWTESSYKYELDQVASLLDGAGFQPLARWVAAESRFALTLARAR
jgi:L-histidine N-alpha-methyltransferase